MKRKGVNLLFTLYFVILIITSCKTQVEGEKFSEIDMPGDINKSLRIWLTDDNSSYREGMPISYLIENTSEYSIVAPVDFEVSCFVFDEEKSQWMELPKLFPQEEELIILSPQNRIYADSVIPNISGVGTSTKVVILIRGLMETGNGESSVDVGAYVEVLVKKN